MKLINLQRYIPDEFFNGVGIQYFKDETGKDWFKHLPKFTRQYSLAVENDTGIIRSISEDASKIYPVGLTVIDIDTLPDGCDISGAWLYKNEKIVPAPIDYLHIATLRRDSEMAAATLRITALVEAQDDGDITDAEKTALAAWREYRSALRRLDISAAPDIDWPDVPL